MIQYFKKYCAIRSYVRRLSRDLVRRFGKRPFYSVEHVTQAVQRGKFSAAFISHAHAAFCSQVDFEAYYKPPGVSESYQDLRRTIARRYLSGSLYFDAETIINKFRQIDYDRCALSESGMGDDSAGH